MASSSNTSSPQRSTGCIPIWPSMNLPSAMSSSTWRPSGGQYTSQFTGYTAANNSCPSCISENLPVWSGMIWGFDTSHQDLWRNFKMTELLCSTFTYRSVVNTFQHLVPELYLITIVCLHLSPSAWRLWVSVPVWIPLVYSPCTVFSVSVCLCGFSPVPPDKFPVFEQM